MLLRICCGIIPAFVNAKTFLYEMDLPENFLDKTKIFLLQYVPNLLRFRHRAGLFCVTIRRRKSNPQLRSIAVGINSIISHIRQSGRAPRIFKRDFPKFWVRAVKRGAGNVP